VAVLSFADLMHQNHHLEVVKLVNASGNKKRLQHMQSRSLQQLNGGVCHQAHMAFNERCSGSPQPKKTRGIWKNRTLYEPAPSIVFSKGFGEICISVQVKAEKTMALKATGAQQPIVLLQHQQQQQHRNRREHWRTIQNGGSHF
jgi:hypothetical protein